MSGSIRRPSAVRRGFTLIEIMVALVLVGIVVGALLNVVARQQRFYSSATDLVELRDNLRQVADLLPEELRPVSPRDGDLVPTLGTALSDSAIELRATVGTAIVCDTALGRATIIVPPYGQANGSGFTSWATMPVQGDSLFVYLPRSSPKVDTMTAHEITSAPTTAICPTTTGFTSVLDQANGVQFTVSPALPVGVIRGAPIRFFRHVRYSLYQSATDGRWYLGYRDANRYRNPAWSGMQLVSGPFLPYAQGGAGGIAFAYFDSVGTVLTTAAQATSVRRVDVTVRGQTRAPVRQAGLGFGALVSGYKRDSLTFSIALRNR